MGWKGHQETTKSAGLYENQHAALEALQNVNLFLARDEDYTQTAVKHQMLDATAIWLRVHCLSLTKRQAAEQKIQEMAAAGFY